jgi:hypothetical protein
LCPANPTWPNPRTPDMPRFRLTLLALLAVLPLLLAACGGGGGY